MMKYSLYFLLLFIPLLSFAHGNHAHISKEEISKVSRVRIFTSPTEIGNLMENGMSIDHGIWRKDIYFECEVFEFDLGLLALTNTEYEIIYQDANEYYHERRQMYAASRKPAEVCNESFEETLADKYEVPEDFATGSFAGFYTYEEMLGHLDNMASKYPDLITERAPISDFKTHEDRDIFYLKMSDNANTDESDNEKQILYTAVHHSREPVSMVQTIFTMYYLLENYDKDPIIKSIIDENELFFVPCVNPDGYFIDQENTFISDNGTYNHAYWRKNGRDNDENGQITNQDGVDLNRNYDFAWGLNDQGSSPTQSSHTYRGPSAASEPEVQAMAWLCEQNNFLIALNCHTFSNILIHPWAYIPFDPTPDSTVFRTIGKALTIDNNYGVGTVDEVLGYSVNGDSDDWMYGAETVNKILAFTPEVGSAADGFYPPEERIVPLCLDMVLQNINAVRCMHNYAYPTLLGEAVTAIEGNFDIEILQAGMEAAPFSVDFEFVNATNETLPSLALDLVFAETFNFSIPFSVNDGLTSDDKVGVKLTFNYDDGISETFSFLRPYTGEEPNIDLFTNIEETGESLAAWNTDAWALTDELSYSPSTSYTDSPNGEYSPGLNYIRYADTIDLSNATIAELKFFARWDIEPDYDYVQINAIDLASQSKTALCGNYTSIGNNFYLAPDEPYYDDTQNSWVEETMDLSDFLGKEISIEFEFYADNYVEEDGFYFDDFRILTDVDFEVPAVQVASIGDFVWFDENKNGLQDEAENGLADVTVELFDYTNLEESINAVATDSDGKYLFDSLDISKQYAVKFTILDGYEATQTSSDFDSELDSNLNSETNFSEVILLTDGTDKLSIDAGFVLVEEPATSIAELNNNFSIYPNPADDVLNIDIKGDNATLLVSNIEGKIVQEIILENGNNIIDVSTFSSGLYFYQIEQANVVSKTQKLIIAH